MEWGILAGATIISTIVIALITSRLGRILKVSAPPIAGAYDIPTSIKEIATYDCTCVPKRRWKSAIEKIDRMERSGDDSLVQYHREAYEEHIDSNKVDVKHDTTDYGLIMDYAEQDNPDKPIRRIKIVFLSERA